MTLENGPAPAGPETQVTIELGEPLLQASGSLEGATKITIDKVPTKKTYGPYKFTIKNGQDHDHHQLLFHGEVGYKRTAIVYGNNGPAEPLLEIKRIKRSDDVLDKDLKNSIHFTICTGTYGTLLGSCTFGPGITDESTVIKSEIDGHIYGLELVKNPPPPDQMPSTTSTETKDKKPDTEINIVSNGKTFAKLHIPTGKTFDFDSFDCSIEFSESVQGEKSKQLVLGMTISYLLCRNGNIMTPGQHKFWAGLGILFALGIIVGIIVGIVYLFSYLNENCNRPGYSTGGKRRY